MQNYAGYVQSTIRNLTFFVKKLLKYFNPITHILAHVC